MSTRETPDEPQASALVKGLRVLEAVTTRHRLSEIAAETGLSNSTVHRILTDLAAHGWVERAGDRTYRPGLRPHAFAALLLRDEAHIRVLVTPHLRALRDDIGFTVHMARWADEHLVYSAKLDGLGSYQMRSRVGMEISPFTTAIGKAVLAAIDEGTARELVARAELVPKTPRTVLSHAELLEQIAVTRERGWSYDDGENEVGTRCVGVAVVDGAGTVVGGLSVSGLEHELTPERAAALAPRVLAAGRAVSAALGAELDGDPAGAGPPG